MSWWMIALIVAGSVAALGLAFYVGMAWMAWQVMKGFSR